MTPLRSLLAIVLLAASGPALAQQQQQRVDCGTDAARIRKAETELPRLEVAPPNDKQIVCITLETNVVFARRLLAHVKQCPRSTYARNVDAWTRRESEYLDLFRNRDCKPAIKSYRG